MLDIKLIRRNPELIKEGLKKRNFDIGLVDKVLELDERRRHVLKELENERAEINKKSKGMPSPAEIENLKKVKEKIKILENELGLIEKDFNAAMYYLPNLPLPDVPVGKNEKDNKVLYEVGKKPKFNFEPKKHYEIGESLDIIDTQRAAKVSGSRFGYLKGQAALLEFALINFALKKLVKKGFIPIIPPVLIKEEMMKGMGYIDTEVDREERYFFEKDKQYLVGTSEQTVGPMHSGEIFEKKDLPLRYISFSSCFRREAGSYGKDVRGVMRVHQFNKLEMFSYSKPEDSVSEHKLFLAIEEELMKELALPYRVIHLSTGDLARPSASTFDIETWLPGLGEYKETHSVSNTTDFQSRRLNIRMRSKNGELEFVHMLNGTVFSERPILAILENYQQKDGSIKIPKALKKYM
ncbi:MAG: serine--tRNA ligase [Parcubacteria group bacterium RIFCSPLOWO2_01_FULL_40_65]|nr:MAG: serine--tRNA ligase [Parcubacteria group bacterium RIFCSPHIGHO2_01_FULL_40_30]OHB18984.1 MAG: serine--tRNA ligase [Parcubacteria group bacterium RIFCSPHIGHO2_02_FULL_40_12]OHB21161.1 MAG: serine--tRNA ligase [Parcubacteria group bacterium RIFCSPLOWO2_01_FULL_40_65]OHB22920.1 MAG: serine--tRNA ligase [Parcubacteria group bacterium RIFCSPLOWO2_02_FULL_40_12]OHB24076.1 MAG: serine--tRNA ligase [Parcubacteria group bacterium RIFCSPLOWO2_12_FULL_40_10]